MLKYLGLLLLLLPSQHIKLNLSAFSAPVGEFYFVTGEPTFYSYESSTNLVDDGQNVVAQLNERNFDSSKSSQPLVNQRIFVSPSGGSSGSSESLNKIISKNQILSNNIGSGLFRSFEVPVRNYRKSRGFRKSYLTSARTVESPALSVDSGGQASTSLAKELAKVFNVKQGFYSGIYDNMERRINKPTKRPPEAIEESARELIQEMFGDQNRQPSKRNLNNAI